MTRWTKVCGIALAALIAIPVLAQRGPGGPGGFPRYDPKTEVTIKGTVEAVSEGTSHGGWSTGQQVTVKTASGSFEVRLGPADYWQKNGFPLAKGDAIEVTGAKVQGRDGEALLAREVKKGGKTVTLRDAQGMPAWPREHRPA